MIDAAAWEALKTSAYEQLADERSERGLKTLRAVSGVHWVDPGWPDRLPPTPPTRDLSATVWLLPRHLRRQVERLERLPDHGGLFEVLGIVHDAFFEAELTGENRLPLYLEHLAECGFSWQVLRLIGALYEWFICGGVEDIDPFAKLLFSALVAAAAFRADAQRSGVIHEPTPLTMRPRLVSHAPPDPLGSTTRPLCSVG